MEFSPDGNVIAACAGKNLRVFDVRTGSAVFTAAAPRDFLSCGFSSDGRCLAAKTFDSIHVFDGRTGGLKCAIAGLDSQFAFCPDGTRVLVDGKLHDTESGAQLLDFESYRLDFDGGTFVTSRHRSVQLYDAPAEADAWRASRRDALARGRSGWHEGEARENARLGRWFAAEFHWARANPSGPRSAMDHYSRGAALAHLGKDEDAKAELAKALAAEHSLDLPERAEAYAMLGDWAKSARIFEDALADNPESERVGYAVASLRLVHGDVAGYRQQCAAIVERKANWTLSYDDIRVLALGADSLSKLSRVVESARGMAEHYGTIRRVHGAFGAILYRAGLLDAGQAELRKAAGQGQSSAAIDLAFLAMAAHKNKRPDEARLLLSQAQQGIAVTLQPNAVGLAC